ncbi:hypothetical protein AKN40_0167 [Escherichia coli]|nr:hypothetical protein AKN40_0167 [Escherichia coli]
MITIPGVTLCGMSGLRINDIFLLPGLSCVEKKGTDYHARQQA